MFKFSLVLFLLTSFFGGLTILLFKILGKSSQITGLFFDVFGLFFVLTILAALIGMFETAKDYYHKIKQKF